VALSLLVVITLTACSGSGAERERAPAQSGTAQDELGRALDELIAPLIADQWLVGVSIGVWQDGSEQYFGYGAVSQSGSPTPSPDTVFEIGSVSKVFTGMLLAEMVGQGAVTLDTPIAELLPAASVVPHKGETAIALRHLTTHTSGLPRLPDNLTFSDPLNPYADYTEADLLAFLANHQLADEPGSHWEYSNLGVGLLGYGLARKAAAPSYEQALYERVLAPLALADTAIELDSDQLARFAVGHDSEAAPVPHWDLSVLAGAGGLRSTTRDLLAFARANIAPSRDAPLASALQAAQAPLFEVAPGTSIGMGWFLSGGLIWHNGETGGFASLVVIDPTAQRALVMLTNTAAARVDLAPALLTILAGGQPAPLDLPPTIAASADLLERYVGEYEVQPGLRFTISRQGECLFAQLTGQGPARIYPSTTTDFYYRAVDASIAFQLDRGGNVTGLILHQAGQELPAHIVPPPGRRFLVPGQD
jgi:CubicO group peptidase (beta-lactamase class C family)